MQKYISLLDLGWHTLQLPSFLAAYNLSDVGQCVVLHLSGKLEVVGSNPIGIAVFSFFFFPLPGYAILTMSKFRPTTFISTCIWKLSTIMYP